MGAARRLCSGFMFPGRSFGFFTLGFCFYALGADERQEIFGVEGIAAKRLLPGGIQGDVYAAIVGQDEQG